MARESALKSQNNYKEIFEDVFSGIGCIDVMFHYLCATKAFQRWVRVIPPAKNHNTIRHDETVEWCNSFVLVPKCN